jgi:hypothetical protein
VAAVAPPIAKDKSFIIKPINPIKPIPKKLIFIDSQSSVFPGFTASLRVLVHWVMNDCIPIITALKRLTKE